ncbi:SelD-related putative sulfur metabolism protein [Pyrobaculum aerophilum]|uniref:acylphosphatase n=1 Tax=Pyrobaculum aerophilum TaxID=13773 RepID=A0A371R4C1_9CREN|nr:SelD-related putative sulfur metabolism protein [Pyrobaculum aerophilum]RFA98639.1 acylphosphatase [Pyrobaculum aerophilum]
MNRLERFKERVKLYREAGIALESLSLGCSVKVDLYNVLYPALQLLREEMYKLNLVIAPREDAAIMPGASAALRRYFLDVEHPRLDPAEVEKLSPTVAIVLAQVYMGKAAAPDLFAKYVAGLYKALGSSRHKVWLGKGHSIISTKKGAEFFMVDFLKAEGQEGYIVANNDTIQVIDPSEDFDSPLQIAVAVNNALNDLFTKGAWKDIHIAPVYDAPPPFRGPLEARVKSYASSLGKLVEAPQPEMGYLLLGATAYARLDREPPLFYDKIREGFVVVVTRPFGELAYFTTYVAVHTDETLMKKFEEEVMPIEQFEAEKRRALEIMATPNLEAAKAIYQYLPDLGERFDPEAHIAATIDVSGPGIFVFKEVAERAGVDIRLFDVPLMSSAVSKFAADNYIMPDATAGTNGAIAIFASRKVAEELVEKLSKAPHAKPAVIGVVEGKGEGRLIVPEWALQYISSKKLREKLGAASVLGGLARVVGRPIRAVAYVEGAVQGVGFRPMARARAKALGLLGYAKNLPDGRVEVVVEGDEERVRKYVEELCKGFENCRVGQVIYAEARGEFSDFSIL